MSEYYFNANFRVKKALRLRRTKKHRVKKLAVERRAVAAVKRGQRKKAKNSFTFQFSLSTISNPSNKRPVYSKVTVRYVFSLEKVEGFETFHKL